MLCKGSELGLTAYLLRGGMTLLLLSSLFVSLPRGIALLAGLEYLSLMLMMSVVSSTWDLGRSKPFQIFSLKTRLLTDLQSRSIFSAQVGGDFLGHPYAQPPNCQSNTSVRGSWVDYSLSVGSELKWLKKISSFL